MISILIPTHNRSALLSRTLDSISQLDGVADIPCELIVVTNACIDDTEQVVQQWASRIAMPVRCVVEAEPGLSVARNCGMRKAEGNIFAFLDDDVWLASTWLTALHATYQKFPADIVAGRVTLWWEEVQPPAWWSRQMDGCLSKFDRGNAIIEIRTRNTIVGANFAIRRAVFDEIGLFSNRLGRTGRKLLGGEEYEYVNRALDAGFCVYYSPETHVKHWVPRERLKWDYLSRWSRDTAMSRVLIKSPYGWSAAARSLAGHLWLCCRHAAHEAMARIIGPDTRCIQHRIFFHTGLGGLRGVWNRGMPGRRRNN